MAGKRKQKSDKQSEGELFRDILLATQEADKIAGTIRFKASAKSAKASKNSDENTPPNLGRAIHLNTVDFNDPERPLTCLEVDFPLVPINALSALEGNAGKPIYQMSKWWARRRSSIFRATLIAAASRAPENSTATARLVWDHYYANHQKAGSFKNLRVLDNFMGGGTTLVEGSRLGMQVTGIDLNPVAWLVVKNELAAADPEKVKALFEHIEAEVKPAIMPFYITSCPRGHKGQWIDRRNRQSAEINPLLLPLQERKNYVWEGPEIIYTFWAKHGPCPASGCGHRTPVFSSPLVAEKKLSAAYIEMNCPVCGLVFQAELGETRMAPGVPRVVLPKEAPFTELSQDYAQALKDYGKGRSEDKLTRILRLLEATPGERALYCPDCGAFTGGALMEILEEQRGPFRGMADGQAVYAFRAGQVDKKVLGIQKKNVYMSLLIDPEWLCGSPGRLDGRELGGYAKAGVEATAAWYRERLNNMQLFEVRGRIPLNEDESLALLGTKEEINNQQEDFIDNEEIAEAGEQSSERRRHGLPRYIRLPDGRIMDTRKGTVPGKSKFTCQNPACGRENDLLTAVRSSLSLEDVAAALLRGGCCQAQVQRWKENGCLGLVRQALVNGEKDDEEVLELVNDSGFDRSALEQVQEARRSAPVAPYALQCHCPQCEAEGYNYNGRYFKAPDAADLERLIAAEREWEQRKDGELKDYWPREKLPYAWMTHHLNGGIPNWGYTHWWTMFNPRQLLVQSQILCVLMNLPAPIDIFRDEILGGFQQYLRNQNMFCFWDREYDKLVPMLSNANFHPKALVVENGVFHRLGRGNMASIKDTLFEGYSWTQQGWEFYLPNEGRKSIKIDTGEQVVPANELLCGSSTEIKEFKNCFFDLIITDPPFADNVFYSDLSDFFYVWLRIPMLCWYEEKPEADYWRSPATPKALEAIRNRAEHPDTREAWEKTGAIKAEHLEIIREITGDSSLNAGDSNPCCLPEPATEFYEHSLTACWQEAYRVLKPGGMLAFTFHHSDPRQWEPVLHSLFEAGFVLVATYPIRSDESKGEAAAFGSRKIEYDILHVCRKRQDEPLPASWAAMRRWVKESVRNQQRILELYRNQNISEADILVVLRGKALEFYSRHYGKVLTGSGEPLSIRDALLGINQLLKDADSVAGPRPPEAALPITREYLSLFQNNHVLSRDDAHKMLQGTTITLEDLEGLGWVEEQNRRVCPITLERCFARLTRPGKRRDSIKYDLDLAHFAIGAMQEGSGIDLLRELNENRLKYQPAMEAILDWYARTSREVSVRENAARALRLVENWRQDIIKSRKPEFRQEVLA
ncbi:MAG: hypothetical protein PHX14_09265, partial [Syntrophomonadaceae bacterium]|nr:hypothetical protein [Syntrophomonadaceae bacterium]